MLSKLVKTLMREKDAGPFKVPVDVVALRIPDYPRIIRHPMDLGTIDRWLSEEPCVYTHPHQVINDVRMVFRNCYTYNAATTVIWKMAESLSRKFEEQLAAYANVPASYL